MICVKINAVMFPQHFKNTMQSLFRTINLTDKIYSYACYVSLSEYTDNAAASDTLCALITINRCINRSNFCQLDVFVWLPPSGIYPAYQVRVQ